MGVFGKKKSPSRRDERQLVEDRDDEGSDCDDNVGLEFESDESSSSLGGNKYEPPPTINSFIIATANANSIAADSGTAENTGTTSPRVAVATPSVEILRPEPNMQNKNTKGNAAIDSSIINHEPETSTGCCATAEAWELGYNLERFRLIKNKRKTLSKRLSSFSHRWKSFRDNQLAIRSRNLRSNNREGYDDGTLSSDGSTNSYGYSNDENNGDNDNEDNDSDDRFSGVYQPFGRLCRAGKHANNNNGNNNNNNRRNNRTIRATSMEGDTDSLATNRPCNEYARRQFEVWKAASIEGPRAIKVASFVLALVLLVCTVGMAMAINAYHKDDNFWTPGAVVACCHLVVATLFILLLESRSNLIGKGILRDLVRCECSASVEDDMTDYRDVVLPMDSYREYGDNQHSDGDYTAKPRHDVVRNIRLFRYLYGRGFLYVFAGSIAFATIPGHLEDYPAAFFAICLPGIALTLVGALAVLAGIHATFRWTLLETSIVGDDDHLRDKFRSVGQSESNNDNDKRENVGLNRDGFSVLVTTLGLDLDEPTLMPTVFALEVRPKEPNAMTFEEFRKWWRGKDATPSKRSSSSPHKSPRSPGSRRGKETASSLASTPSSSEGSLV